LWVFKCRFQDVVSNGVKVTGNSVASKSCSLSRNRSAASERVEDSRLARHRELIWVDILVLTMEHVAKCPTPLAVADVTDGGIHGVR
jgi:hypothetical protein